jgi:hypothetical protein
MARNTIKRHLSNTQVKKAMLSQQGLNQRFAKAIQQQDFYLNAMAEFLIKKGFCTEAELVDHLSELMNPPKENVADVPTQEAQSQPAPTGSENESRGTTQEDQSPSEEVLQ